MVERRVSRFAPERGGSHLRSFCKNVLSEVPYRGYSRKEREGISEFKIERYVDGGISGQV